MFKKYGRASIIASAVGLALVFSAPVARAASTQLMSSPVFWSANGDHADLVLQYAPNGTGTLTISTFLVAAVGGAGVQEQLNFCGTPVKQGDTIVAHAISPGQFCFLRALHAGVTNSVYGRVVVSDTTGKLQNINMAVRVSLETRDANDNVLTHVEVH